MSDLSVTPGGELVIAGFVFHPTALKYEGGTPTFEDWDRVGHFLRYVHTGAQFWLGDWINIGEHAYGEKYTQALEHTGYDLHTLETYAWVARQVPASNRLEQVPFGHYQNGLAALEPADQKRWAELIAEQNMTRAEFKAQLRLEQRAKHATNVPLPKGKFRVFYVDPPWSYDDEGVLDDGSHTKAVGHYPTMSIEALCKLEVRKLVPDSAVMFLWIPTPLLLQNPGPREVIEAWGFEYKSGMVWDKIAHNVGHYVSNRHEHLVICTRGSCLPDNLTPMIDSVYQEKKSPKHSEKPKAMRKIIERLYDRGPYIELFGREPVKGWTVYGNDLALGDVPTQDKPKAAPKGKAKAKKRR